MTVAAEVLDGIRKRSEISIDENPQCFMLRSITIGVSVPKVEDKHFETGSLTVGVTPPCFEMCGRLILERRLKHGARQDDSTENKS
jgi:hypothetical protein